MNVKKHISILCTSLLLSSIAFAQQKYPEAMGNANKKIDPAALESIRKSKAKDTDGNIRVSDELMELYKQKKIPTTQKNKDNSVDAFSNIMTKGSKVRIQIIASSISEVPELIKILTSKGLSDIVSYEDFINADIEVSKINLLEEITSIMMVKPVYKPTLNSGAVQSQADKAIRADIARNNFGVNGHGIKIGILSDSYNALGGAVAGVNAGELPGIGNPAGFVKPVVVLKDLSISQNPNLIDEGRGMAEIVHDVAPGAEIYFYTAFDGEADFANGIRALANAGCKIIVDDVTYFAEPYFQDGILARAVEDVTNQGVSYFTSAGNSSSRSYEFGFKPFNFANAGETPQFLHNFNSDPSNPIDNLPIFCPTGNVGVITLQWTQPFKSISGGFGARTDLDIFILDNNFNVIASNIFNDIGTDPVTQVAFQNNTQSPVLRVVILKRSGINVQKIKMVFNRGIRLFSDLQNTPGLFSSTITGQANARSAITVGAANYQNTIAFGSPTNIIQEFSSKGGLDVLFNRFGGRTFERRFKPEIVAADNGNTSFFGIDNDGDGLPNFDGTSASAPHAAAVAALCLEASNCFQLSPFYVKSAFILNAADMDDPETPGFDFGFDFKTGNGFINAEGILSYFDFCFNNKNAEAKNKTTNTIEKKDLNEFSIVGLFPNPVKDLLNISVSGNDIINNTNLAIKIIDLSGKQIPATPSVKGNIISINVQALVAGTYVAQINKNGKIKNISFIKQ
jgi:subtilisin family serine protease